MSLATALPFSADGRLQGGRCARCGALAFPPPPVCATCLSQEIDAYPLPHEGRLYSFTVVHRKDEAPLSVGYVDLPDGLRLFGIIDPATAPAVDRPVTVRLDPDGPPHCRFTAGEE